MNYENWADSKPEGKGHYIVLSRMEAFKWENVKRKHESPFLCSQGRYNSISIMCRVTSPSNTFP